MAGRRVLPGGAAGVLGCSSSSHQVKVQLILMCGGVLRHVVAGKSKEWVVRNQEIHTSCFGHSNTLVSWGKKKSPPDRKLRAVLAQGLVSEP